MFTLVNGIFLYSSTIISSPYLPNFHYLFYRAQAAVLAQDQYGHFVFFRHADFRNKRLSLSPPTFKTLTLVAQSLSEQTTAHQGARLFCTMV